MGSGALLAILVALWFVVLVPMVVTRGDLAAGPAEPMRVLRRRSDSRAMSSSPTSSKGHQMGTRANPGHQAENMLTEPIPVLPRRVPGATLQTEMPPVPAPRTRPADEKPVAEATASERHTPAGGDIRGRRQRMLLALVAVAVLSAALAAFWQPMFWWPQVVLDLAVFGYMVFLRLEAQREQDRQERRRARASVPVTLPEDRTQRLVRKQTEYRDHVTAVTGNQAIALDDDDPGFTEMPTWTPDAAMAAEAPAWHERKAV